MMVESLSELNRLCQKPEYKTKGNWYVRSILRDAALPMTWLLLHTPITANQVTLFSLGVSFAGMFFLSMSGSGGFLTGVFLLQLWYYLDHVDGQIARYRKTNSLTGRFLDFLMHHIVHTALFFALGFYAFQTTRNPLFVLWGFVSAMAILVFNITHDVQYKAFFEKIDGLRCEGPVVLPQKEGHSVKDAASREGSRLPGHSLSVSKRLFSIAHKLCEIHVLMNMLTLGALAQMFWDVFDVRMSLFLIYGSVAPLIAIVKVAYILRAQKIDSLYREMICSKPSNVGS